MQRTILDRLARGEAGHGTEHRDLDGGRRPVGDDELGQDGGEEHDHLRVGQTDHEGVRLSIGALVIVAKDSLESLRLNQVGERGDLLRRNSAFDQN